MNPDKIKAAIQKNKKGLAAAGALAVAGVALLQSRKGGSDAAPNPTSTTAIAPRPTGAAISGYAPAGGAYDSTASDVYNAIQPQLEKLNQLYETQKAPVPVPAPPIASTLFEATGQGSYLRNDHGGWLEVQRDGSIFGLGARDVGRLGLGRAEGPAYQQLKVEDIPAYYTLQGNLSAAGSGSKASRWLPTKQADGKYKFVAVD